MTENTSRGNLLGIPLIEEKFGRSFLFSLVIHALAAVILLYAGYLLPRAAIVIGSGPGGGTGGDTYTVGVVDELSGGMGMIKPALVPQPPALLKEAPPKTDKAIPLAGTTEPKKTKPTAKEMERSAKIDPKSNVIPTEPEPGSGGIAGRSGGSGGGIGGGIGLSIGSGSGGFGNSYYARIVEARISSNWLRPAEGIHVEMIYSFYIAADGTIYGVKKEKSSGNQQMDLTAERAIRASSPLSAPPQEFRGRPVQFVAQFVHPPLNP
jgi:TonB family protein